jgi:hypothetical protein
LLKEAAEMRFSKIIVASIIILTIIFTAAVLFVFYKTSVEPTSLVVAFFAFSTGELWALAGIKKAETKHSRPPDDPDNNT